MLFSNTIVTRVSALLLLLFFSMANATSPRDPYKFFFEQSLGDLTEELGIARDENKKGMFVFF